MSKDDEYWHSIMQALGDEFLNEGTRMRQEQGMDSPWREWTKAGKEVKATADQALKTAGVAESIIKAREGRA